MKIVISPAKTLDFESPLPTREFSKPQFLKHSRAINKELKQLSPAELSQMMDISPKLAELNWQRNRSRTFLISGISDKARQAVYAFNGEVYLGLDAYTIADDKVEVFQQKLRILSGLYGLLKPLDLIQPYRLEMGTHLKVGESKNLYEIWKPILAKALNKEMKKGELLVNLASHEYFSSIDIKSLKATVVTPEFRDFRDGQMKMISFFAKKARGAMVRFIIDSGAETVEDLKGFSRDGYAFDDNLSQGNTLVFTR